MDTAELRRISGVQDTSRWYRERRSVLARELRGLGGPGHAIDIGPAGCRTGRTLLDRGWAVMAVDESADAVELALAQGVEACQGDARHLPFPEADFDLAVAFDVLARVEDDRAAAAEITRVLRPGGTALICVPCDPGLWSVEDLLLGHVRRYTRPELADLLTGAGLLTDRMWSWNILLRPWLRRSRHRPTGHVLAEPGRFTDLLHRATLAAERRLPIKDRPGAALFARAHRPIP
ncbi:class I SAM-dependent methyltransferase [Actinomadura craniellae]|uniref:Class I SAM-dependent methyltransferase n=1 Tax=Actinomadura craniellae TaxID=2231787 RepID=A0A365H7T7_9ACTN|nr:class I SAM-dependent methyltransferase [Actinomadura craniellae]RAY15088.1 class I SAM-dependent methyltransferase [Actinomadura craniellae]